MVARRHDSPAKRSTAPARCWFWGAGTHVRSRRDPSTVPRSPGLRGRTGRLSVFMGPCPCSGVLGRYRFENWGDASANTKLWGGRGGHPPCWVVLWAWPAFRATELTS